METQHATKAKGIGIPVPSMESDFIQTVENIRADFYQRMTNVKDELDYIGFHLDKQLEELKNRLMEHKQ